MPHPKLKHSQFILHIVLFMSFSFSMHCAKNLFVLASRQKILFLRRENPSVDTRTICPPPIEFFTIPKVTAGKSLPVTTDTAGKSRPGGRPFSSSSRRKSYALFYQAFAFVSLEILPCNCRQYPPPPLPPLIPQVKTRKVLEKNPPNKSGTFCVHIMQIYIRGVKNTFLTP
jgi:hypothetical protein